MTPSLARAAFVQGEDPRSGQKHDENDDADDSRGAGGDTSEREDEGDDKRAKPGEAEGGGGENADAAVFEVPVERPASADGLGEADGDHAGLSQGKGKWEGTKIKKETDPMLLT